MTEQIYEVSFWASIIFVILGCLLGLSAVWLEGFWGSDLAQKLFLTDVILTVTAIVTAVITKWLA